MTLRRAGTSKFVDVTTVDVGGLVTIDGADRGEWVRRIVKRREKLKALVAVARSILVVVWRLLADPAARFHDLGSDYHTRRLHTKPQLRNHLVQLAALGYGVTVERRRGQ